MTNTNDAPTVANPIADQNATEDSAFSFTVPANTFADVDAGDTLTYSATLADGSALPAWLRFNAGNRDLHRARRRTPMSAPSTVTVTATDGSNSSASDTFTHHRQPTPTTPRRREPARRPCRRKA